VLNAEHLRRIIAKYATYYNEVRTHVSLGKDAPCRRPVERLGDIVAYPVRGHGRRAGYHTPWPSSGGGLCAGPDIGLAACWQRLERVTLPLQGRYMPARVSQYSGAP
jgi:hypothetical protein